MLTSAGIGVADEGIEMYEGTIFDHERMREFTPLIFNNS